MVMKMLICLGNFGGKYELTRHNMGFMFADNLAIKYNTSFKQDTIKLENKRCLNTIAEEGSTGFKKQMEEI